MDDQHEQWVGQQNLPAMTTHVLTMLRHHRPLAALDDGELWLRQTHSDGSDGSRSQTAGTRRTADCTEFWLGLYRASQLSPEGAYPRFLDAARRCSDYTPALERRVLQIGRWPVYRLLAFPASRRYERQAQR